MSASSGATVPIDQADDEVSEKALSAQEQSRLDGALSRSLLDVRTLGTRVLSERYSEYRDAIVKGARIAKAQMNQNFGGFQASASRFVVRPLASEYLGYSTWDQFPDVTANSTQQWIDSAQGDLLAGTANEPIKVGDQAVHVVFGYGTLAQSPKITRFKPYFQRNPRTVVPAEEQFRETDTKFVGLDAPRIIPEDFEYEEEVYAVAGGNEAPRLYGVSFIDGQAARRANPTAFIGTSTSNNVLVEQ